MKKNTKRILLILVLIIVVFVFIDNLENDISKVSLVEVDNIFENIYAT